MLARVASVAPKLAARLASIGPEIQKYGDIPPGRGYGVVYAGVCLATGKIYVGRHVHGVGGRSVRDTRWNAHKRGRSNRGCCRLYNEIAKYGTSNFAWFILERVPEEEIALTEESWISTFDCIENGLNLKTVEGFSATSKETRDRMSTSAKRRLSSEESRKDWSKKTKEMQNRPEQREKLRQIQLAKREKELASCTTDLERKNLMQLFAKRDEFNLRVRARKDRGETRTKRGTPEFHKKMKHVAARKAEKGLK